MTSAETTGPEWGQSFTYDGFGNLTQQTVTKGSAPAMSMTVDAATNRLTGTGVGYDAAGNLTSVPGMGFSYDALGRMSGAAGESYVYGPRNERVLINKTGGVRELNIYGVDGLLYQVWRHDGTSWSNVASKERIYFAGRLIRIGDETVATDRLGSVVYKGKCALENMGFESSTLTPWAPYGEAAIVASTTARTGSKSMRLTVSVADRGAYRDFSGLKPGTVYTVRAYARAETTSASVAVAVSDTTGANMAWSGPMSVSIFWQQFSATFTATSLGTMRIHLVGYTTTQAVFWDDVSIEGEMTCAGTRMSYYPYGQEIGTTANDTVKFGTYTRDAATGLDYAMNRYYQSTWGLCSAKITSARRINGFRVGS